MRIKCIFVLFLNFSTAVAQHVHLQGGIVDAQTNRPIPAATISIPSKNLYFPANGDGKFSIESKNLNLADSADFSCVGYQTKRVKIGDLGPNSIIKLTLLVTMLQEVRIGYKPAEPVKVGSKLRSTANYESYLPGFEQATFMAGSANVRGTIYSVGFYLGNGKSLTSNKGGDVTAPFRIKIYGVDSAGMPGRELTRDVIVVSAKKNNAWFDVDISGYHIENPDGGFFVAFCLLGKEYYAIKKSYKKNYGSTGTSADIITSRLGYTHSEFSETQSYHTSGTGARGKWHKSPFNNTHLVRATVAGN